VAAWVGAVVLAGGVAWGAVSTFEGGGGSGPLGAADVRSALATAQAAAQRRASASPSLMPTGPDATPSPSATGTPGPTPTSGSPQSATPPAPREVARTWAVTGGTVVATCTGSTITLAYATPQDGWTVEVGSSGPEYVEVELHTDAAETRLRAACVDGVPVPDVAQDGGDEDD
jgi:hypothetical protein